MGIKIKLLSQFYKKTNSLLPELFAAGFDDLMEYQQEHYQSLLDSHIVINAGHNRSEALSASLLHLFRNEMQSISSRTLIIVPTNIGIEQRFAEVSNFVGQHNLPHFVKILDSAVIHQLIAANKAEAWQPYEVLKLVLRAPQNPKIVSLLNTQGEDQNNNRPLILIITSDLLKYIFQGKYTQVELQNLMSDLVENFEYLIVDDFFYSNPKPATAFFYFILLLYLFRFFTGHRRLSFLTAILNPRINQFFENLKTLGVLTSWIRPVSVAPTDPGAVLSTTEIALELVASENSRAPVVLEPLIKARISAIRSSIANGRNVVLRSPTLIDISNCARLFNREEYTTYTGAVSSVFRKEAACSKLLLATSTVETGFLFPQSSKDQPGLNDLYFAVQYLDDFWQLLGEVGQVSPQNTGLKPSIVTSTAICSVSPKLFYELESFGLEGLILTQDQLQKKLNQVKGFSRQIGLWDYVENEGIFQIIWGLQDPRSLVASQDQSFAKTVFELFQKTSCLSQIPTWETLLGCCMRFQSLQSEMDAIQTGLPRYPLNLIREFACHLRRQYQLQSDTETSIQQRVLAFSDSDLNLLIDTIINTRSLKIDYQGFIQQEYSLWAEALNFQEVFNGIPALVYDKLRTFHPKQPVTYYDGLHILKNYKNFVYSSEKDFWAEVNLKHPINNLKIFESASPILYLRIDDYQPPHKHLRLQLELSVKDLNVFKKLETNRLQAFQGITISLTIHESFCRHKIPLSPQVVDLFASQYLPMLVLTDQASLFLAHQIMAAGYYTIDLVVSDNKTTASFQVLIGSAAYSIVKFFSGVQSVLDRNKVFYSLL